MKDAANWCNLWQKSLLPSCPSWININVSAALRLGNGACEHSANHGEHQTMLTNLNVAVIGTGTMGEAVIGGLLQAELVQPTQVLAATPRPERRRELSQRWGIATTGDNREAATWGNVVILGIKPQMTEQVLPQLNGAFQADDLIVSVLAGVKMRQIAEATGHSAIARSMPNTPAQIAEGITVWTASKGLDQARRGWAKIVLSAIGEEVEVEDEKFMDMATALSGTGPAYVFMVMEALIDAGVHMGFPRRIAAQLVEQTVIGAVRYSAQSGKHVAELRNMVTSPGGTTAAALYELEKGRLRTVLADGVWAAYRRARELGGE